MGPAQSGGRWTTRGGANDEAALDAWVDSVFGPDFHSCREPGGDQIPKLKEILLGSSNTKNRFLAAYCTAVAYDLQDDHEKSRSYARTLLKEAAGS